jgi:hypothetical protein
MAQVGNSRICDIAQRRRRAPGRRWECPVSAPNPDDAERRVVGADPTVRIDPKRTLRFWPGHASAQDFILLGFDPGEALDAGIAGAEPIAACDTATN